MYIYKYTTHCMSHMQLHIPREINKKYTTYCMFYRSKNTKNTQHIVCSID